MEKMLKDLRKTGVTKRDIMQCMELLEGVDETLIGEMETVCKFQRDSGASAQTVFARFEDTFAKLLARIRDARHEADCPNKAAPVDDTLEVEVKRKKTTWDDADNSNRTVRRVQKRMERAIAAGTIDEDGAFFYAGEDVD